MNTSNGVKWQYETIPYRPCSDYILVVDLTVVVANAGHSDLVLAREFSCPNSVCKPPELQITENMGSQACQGRSVMYVEEQAKRHNSAREMRTPPPPLPPSRRLRG